MLYFPYGRRKQEQQEHHSLDHHSRVGRFGNLFVQAIELCHFVAVLSGVTARQTALRGAVFSVQLEDGACL